MNIEVFLTLILLTLMNFIALLNFACSWWFLFGKNYINYKLKSDQGARHQHGEQKLAKLSWNQLGTPTMIFIIYFNLKFKLPCKHDFECQFIMSEADAFLVFNSC